MLPVQEIRKYEFLGILALKYRLSLNNICRLLQLDITDENKNEVYDKIIKASTNRFLPLKFLLCYEIIGEYEENKNLSQNELDEIKFVKASHGYESSDEANDKFKKAYRFIQKYRLLQNKLNVIIPNKLKEAEESKNLELIKSLKEQYDFNKNSLDKLYEELLKDNIDEEFKTNLTIYELEQQIRKNKNKSKRQITKKEALSFSKYRLKYAISKDKLSELLGIATNTQTRLEETYIKDNDKILYAKIKLLDEFTSEKYKRVSNIR